MQKRTKDNQFIKKPIYPGGLKAMREFIKKKLIYPKDALKGKVEGSVYLRYEVGHKGNVLGSKVLSSLGHGCDEEAQRVVSLMKFQVPKNPRKLRVKFHKKIKINFKLPKAVPVPPAVHPKAPTKRPQRISYTVTTTKKSNPTPPGNNGGYNYTITY